MSYPRWLLVAAFFLASNSCAPAHEIKVLASQLIVEKEDGKSTIYLSWGHRLPVDDLVDADSIARYEVLTPGGAASKLKKADLGLQTNVVELKEAGVHQAVVERKGSVYTYVFDGEGVRQLKRGPKTAVKEGKIDFATRSIQSGKALIVVGKPSKDAVKPLHLPLEIVPLDGPADWTKDKDLRFQVLLEDKPVTGVELTARYVGFKPDNAWCYATASNREGIATVRPSQCGIWVLKVNHKRPARSSDREQFDQESFATTLTLEIRP